MALVVSGAVAQKFIGSVVDKHSSKSMGPHPPGVLTDNATIGAFPGKHDGECVCGTGSSTLACT